eukprot:7381229-Prymnesium_polylepis.2
MGAVQAICAWSATDAGSNHAAHRAVVLERERREADVLQLRLRQAHFDRLQGERVDLDDVEGLILVRHGAVARGSGPATDNCAERTTW